MPKRWCDQCFKSFASRQSLFKHKKRCTENGSSIPLPATISKDHNENQNRIVNNCHNENVKKEQLNATEKNDDGEIMETTN